MQGSLRTNISTVFKSLGAENAPRKRMSLSRRVALAGVGTVLLSLLPAMAEAASQDSGAITIAAHTEITGAAHTSVGAERSTPPANSADPSPTPPPPPGFVCGGEQCANPRSDNSDQGVPNPPQWLTSPNAAACLVSLGAIDLNNSLTDLQQVSGEQADLAKTNGLMDPNYWLVQVKSYGNSFTFPECREWINELKSGR